MPDPVHDRPKSATQAAKLKIAEAVETLHETLRPYASKKARDFFSKFASQDQFDGTVKKIRDDGFIPHSARFKFELVGSKRVSEGAEFAALKAESAAIVKEFQLKLSDKVRAAAELEGKSQRKEASKIVFDATIKMAEAFLLECSTTVVEKRDLLSLSLSVLSSDEILSIVKPLCVDVQVLETELRKAIGCEGKPTQLLGKKHALVSGLTVTIKALFLEPGLAYAEYINEEKMKSRLAKLMKETAQTEANNDVMEIIDSEVSATPKTIEKIVEEKVKQALAKHTKQLGKQNHSLKELGVPTKEGPGTPPQKKPNPNKRRGSPKQRNNPKKAKKQQPSKK